MLHRSILIFVLALLAVVQVAVTIPVLEVREDGLETPEAHNLEAHNVTEPVVNVEAWHGKSKPKKSKSRGKKGKGKKGKGKGNSGGGGYSFTGDVSIVVVQGIWVLSC